MVPVDDTEEESVVVENTSTPLSNANSSSGGDESSAQGTEKKQQTRPRINSTVWIEKFLNKHEWLEHCEEKNTFLCKVCKEFAIKNRSKVWCETGFSDIKRGPEKMMVHENSEGHQKAKKTKH